jgi:hypothetical protein
VRDDAAQLGRGEGVDQHRDRLPLLHLDDVDLVHLDVGGEPRQVVDREQHLPRRHGDAGRQRAGGLARPRPAGATQQRTEVVGAPTERVEVREGRAAPVTRPRELDDPTRGGRDRQVLRPTAGSLEGEHRPGRAAPRRPRPARRSPAAPGRVPGPRSAGGSCGPGGRPLGGLDALLDRGAGLVVLDRGRLGLQRVDERREDGLELAPERPEDGREVDAGRPGGAGQRVRGIHGRLRLRDLQLDAPGAEPDQRVPGRHDVAVADQQLGDLAAGRGGHGDPPRGLELRRRSDGLDHLAADDLGGLHDELLLAIARAERDGGEGDERDESSGRGAQAGTTSIGGEARGYAGVRSRVRSRMPAVIDARRSARSSGGAAPGVETSASARSRRRRHARRRRHSPRASWLPRCLAASIASRKAARTPADSSTRIAAIVVPPGEVTISRSSTG